MPGVVHHGPYPAAIAVCRDVLEESHAACVVLNGSRGWDEQSDLNLIVIHGAAADSGRPGGAVARDRERHYRDSFDEQYSLESGAEVVTPDRYDDGRRTLNHPMARAARHGLVFPREPGIEDRYHHDGGWGHEFQSDLNQLEQYAECGCELVVTDSVQDLPDLWRCPEIDRDAVWQRILDLSG